jgi:uncharacterized membrane protein YsdA (DUF1294 family)
LQYLYLVIIVLNIVTFCIYGEDKRRACGQKWRISERTLFILALLGGAPGALAAMYLFRHKTRKNIFKFGIPCLVLIQLCIIVKLNIG